MKDEGTKKDVYDIILDLWCLVKTIGFAPMTDARWGKMIYESEKLADKYKKRSNALWVLYRRMFDAMQEFFRTIGTDGPYEQVDIQTVISESGRGKE